ncbi:MAG TPA: chromosome segregation protein SMC [Gaiellaceae bacterium]|nr:chromosome segregation protein SMC [Gaiellaceae bacterium]
MHLRAVKLRGFKSFPDPVEIRLEPGVGVIVGPNGSGKSNVSDAIRWAAGSLSPTELRAEKPDDVLFAGGGSRGPSDFCEVELLFDNADGALPVDYAELSVARRLHRGGEGQYLVNRAPVRRLDLVELLADLGLGQGMHSIIGQGKVEAILASKPAERRALIEEAAGLGRFKARRHRAELKLARVALEVERARDVEAEVRKRLRPLALQATAAERAQKLGVEIARLRARIAQLDLAGLEQRLAELETRRGSAAEMRRGVEERLDALLAERGRAEEELADAAGAREQALQALYRLRSAGERLGLRRESAAALLAEARSRHETAAAEAGDPAAELAGLERAWETAAATAQAAAVERVASAERARQALARLLAAQAGERSALEGRLDELLAERRGIESELTGAAGEREAALAVSYELRSHVARLSVQRESAERLSARLRTELADAEADAAHGSPSPRQLEQEALAARARAREALHERDTLAERARTAAERLAALERSLAEREGIPPAARALAEEGERLVLSELEIESGSERAVAAALGPRAAALLAEDTHAALALLERAAALGLGSLVVVAGRNPHELVAELPVVEREELLGSAKPAVTADGFGYDPRTGELWYAGETAEAVLLELDARRRALAEEARTLAEQARFADRKSAEAEERAVAAEQAFAAVAPRLTIRRADAGTLATLAALARRLERALAALDAHVERIEAPLRTRGEAGAERTGELGERLRAIAEREAALRGELAEAAERVAAAERDVLRLGGRPAIVEGAAGDAASLRVKVATLVAAADAAALRASEAAEAARAAETARIDAAVRAGRRRARPHELARVVSAAERLDEALLAAASAAAVFEAPLREDVDAGAARSGELGSELRRLGAAEVELRQELAAASESVSALEVEAARLEAEADEARRRFEHAGADEPAEGDDREQLVAAAERLERRRETLGQVNPLAHEEYEAEKARLEELAAQRADLEASLAELEKLRDELTETVERRFAETFDAVRRHFADVTATVFPGGEGRLRLTEAEEDGDDAEPGVEVELRPAGKRVQRLSLLSGGEKALGAIAFLFALFLARPCPFYLLDEVEAALDDTNIGRFVELLRRYSDRAQFVVITHQKRTMEAADVLYGVTMGGEGVSQVVSRRLPREEAEAASAA